MGQGVAGESEFLHADAVMVVQDSMTDCGLLTRVLTTFKILHVLHLHLPSSRSAICNTTENLFVETWDRIGFRNSVACIRGGRGRKEERCAGEEGFCC